MTINILRAGISRHEGPPPAGAQHRPPNWYSSNTPAYGMPLSFLKIAHRFGVSRSKTHETKLCNQI